MMMAGSQVKFKFFAFLSFGVKFNELKFASAFRVLAASSFGACLATRLAAKTARNKNKIFLIVVL